jgi:hypothetical protein
MPISEPGMPISEPGMPISEASMPISEPSMPISEASMPISDPSMPTSRRVCPFRQSYAQVRDMTNNTSKRRFYHGKTLIWGNDNIENRVFGPVIL